MANLTQRDHHWRKCHAPGVEQVEILFCSSKNGQQVANLGGGVRPFLKSGNITSGLRKKCTGFYL